MLPRLTSLRALQALVFSVSLSLSIATAWSELAAQAPPAAGAREATSLDGKPLVSPTLSGAQKDKLEADLKAAEATLARDPKSADAGVWVGRRLAYLGRYRDSIAAFGKVIADHPDDPHAYRHRGHRYITVREFDKAIADLAKAAELTRGKPDEVEPDGAPNKAGIPRSTLQSNIWYHLGLAHYLKGDFPKALEAYKQGMVASKVNDDMLVATSDWLYMTLRRMKRDAEAKAVLEPIREQMDVIENQAYHQRLLMYKGQRTPESVLNLNTADGVQIATQGYGVGNWYLVNGNPAKAKEIFARVVSGSAWAAFGFIAAEADLHRGM